MILLKYPTQITHAYAYFNLIGIFQQKKNIRVHVS